MDIKLDKKKIAMVLFIIALIVVILNIIVIYPFINCGYAPLVFWLFAILIFLAGIFLYYDIQIFHPEEE